MELKETLKNIKAGIILNGEIYEAVKTENLSCSGCALNDNFGCLLSYGDVLCETIEHNCAMENCIFKKVNIN